MVTAKELQSIVVYSFELSLFLSLVSFRKETICDALAQSEWRNLCGNFLVHPKCRLGGSTKFQTYQQLTVRVGGGGEVRNPTLSKDAKFQVKNFSLYQVLWTLFFSGGGMQ